MYVLLEAWLSSSNFQSLQMDPFTIRLGNGHFFLAPYVQTLGEVAAVIDCLSLKICLLAIVSRISRIQASLAFRAQFWEAHLSSENLKSWSTRCGAQTLHSSERSWQLGVPSGLYALYQGWGFLASVCLNIFHPIQCRYFLIHLMCRAFEFLSEMISLCAAIHSSCSWQEGHSGAPSVISSWSTCSFFFYLNELK